jgi:hypothetical protein
MLWGVMVIIASAAMRQSGSGPICDLGDSTYQSGLVMEARSFPLSAKAAALNNATRAECEKS